MKKVALLMFLLPLFNFTALAQDDDNQINSIDDFITKLEELRTISQKMGSYYILTNLYPTNETYKEKEKKNIDNFNNLLVKLINKAPSEELSIELQKLNLTWLYVGKVLKHKYDRMEAAKVLDKLEEMQTETKSIIDKTLELTKKSRAKILKVAAETRFYLQRMNLYYMADKAKIINTHIADRYNESVSKIKENLSYLKNSPYNDESTNMVLDMIVSKFKTLGKSSLKSSKYSPLTANMVAEGFDGDLKLLIKVYKERIKN